MRAYLSVTVVIAALGLAVWWQAGKIAELAATAEDRARHIERLEIQRERADKAVLQWRGDYEQIERNYADIQRESRRKTRSDPALAEFMAVPLHPALLPHGGLLGEKPGT